VNLLYLADDLHDNPLSDPSIAVPASGYKVEVYYKSEKLDDKTRTILQSGSLDAIGTHIRTIIRR
jgi:hypothetical protein